MNNNGNSDPSNVFQQPIGHFDVDQRAVDINLLFRKLCPIHSTPLILKQEIRLGDDDTRLRYQCSSCGVYVHFKGDELKSYSAGHALDVVNDMRIKERGLAASKPNPTTNSGIKV